MFQIGQKVEVTKLSHHLWDTSHIREQIKKYLRKRTSWSVLVWVFSLLSSPCSTWSHKSSLPTYNFHSTYSVPPAFYLNSLKIKFQTVGMAQGPTKAYKSRFSIHVTQPLAPSEHTHSTHISSFRISWWTSINQKATDMTVLGVYNTYCSLNIFYSAYKYAYTNEQYSIRITEKFLYVI